MAFLFSFITQVVNRIFTNYSMTKLSNNRAQTRAKLKCTSKKWQTGQRHLVSKGIPRHLTFGFELIRLQMETFCLFDCSAAVSANSELNACHLSFAHLDDPRNSQLRIPSPLPSPLIIRQTNVQSSVSLCCFLLASNPPPPPLLSL